MLLEDNRKLETLVLGIVEDIRTKAVGHVEKGWTDNIVSWCKTGA